MSSIVFVNSCRNLPRLPPETKNGFQASTVERRAGLRAAARHDSFKKAAEELNITASAVSHAVQNLRGSGSASSCFIAAAESSD